MKASTMFRLVIFTAYFMAVGMIAAQQPPSRPQPNPPAVVTPKTPYDSTKAQLLVSKEENVQLKANAMTADFQKQMADLRTQFTDLDKEFNAWQIQVRKDNGWDGTYSYDRTKDQWVHTEAAKPPEPSKPPAPKPADKK